MSEPEPDIHATGRSKDLSHLRIGEFLLLRRLGSGGMADVYLAEQTSLGRQVAVKVLKNDATVGASTPEVLLKRFEQEARAAGGLSHPNIVQVITTGRENDVSYIVQEYVPGLNLSQWMRKHGAPEYGIGLQWMLQITAALRAAGEAGVVHRDVKPENIMVTRTNTVKVTDFGLAQLNQPATPRMNLTQAGTTMGTPWYMSPEQIQGEKLDARSDQYSFGVTCYHMFSGQPPFPGKNAVTVAVQHLKEEPPPLQSRRADLPRELCDVIHRMIKKSPADRFQTADELESALQRLTRIPVNSRMGSPTDWIARLNAARPDGRGALVAFALLFLAAYAVGRQAERPLRLPPTPAPAEIPKESTPVRQYALAMLQSDRSAAWEAVISGFPDSDEADLARIRLGLCHLTAVVPDETKAIEAFRNLQQKGLISPDKRHLVVLGLLGQIYVLSYLPERPGADAALRSDERDRLTVELRDLLNQPETQVAVSLNDAPVELVRFFNEEFSGQR
jgi:serine/threonine protein kinase